MGNHRGQRRAPRRATRATSGQAAGTAVEQGTQAPYVGRRVAGRPVVADLPMTITAAPAVPASSPTANSPAPAPAPVAPVVAVATAAAGRRRAARGERRTHPLVRSLRPRPVLVGVAALAVAFGGAASSASESGDLTAELAGSGRSLHAPTALGGTSGTGTVSGGAERAAASVSRDSSRQALESASGSKLVAAAEQQAQERNAALAEFAAQAEQQAEKLAENQWSLPLASYRLTAQFGDYGLWASYHTGLDFAAPTGSPIMAVANGTVTETGYDGSYGNKTVVTLDDGTEIWYCHQTTMDVSVGDTVSSGQAIGTVGSTGNVTGPHLHLEVRPGGGDPVDPYSALQVNGLTP